MRILFAEAVALRPDHAQVDQPANVVDVDPRATATSSIESFTRRPSIQHDGGSPVTRSITTLGRRGRLSEALREQTAERLRVDSDRALSADEAEHIAHRLSRRRILALGGVIGAGLLPLGRAFAQEQSGWYGLILTGSPR